MESEIKYNDSTNQRPDGKRIINAPMVNIDLKEFTDQLKDESAWKNSDRNAITVFKNEQLRLVLIALHKEAIMDRHKAEGAITVQVIKGHIHFITDDQVANLKKGEMIVLQEGIHHSVKAIKKSVFLLTMMVKKIAD